MRDRVKQSFVFLPLIILVGISKLALSQEDSWPEYVSSFPEPTYPESGGVADSEYWLVEDRKPRAAKRDIGPDAIIPQIVREQAYTEDEVSRMTDEALTELTKLAMKLVPNRSPFPYVILDEIGNREQRDNLVEIAKYAQADIFWRMAASERLLMRGRLSDEEATTVISVLKDAHEFVSKKPPGNNPSISHINLFHLRQFANDLANAFNLRVREAAIEFAAKLYEDPATRDAGYDLLVNQFYNRSIDRPLDLRQRLRVKILELVEIHGGPETNLPQLELSLDRMDEEQDQIQQRTPEVILWHLGMELQRGAAPVGGTPGPDGKPTPAEMIAMANGTIENDHEYEMLFDFLGVHPNLTGEFSETHAGKLAMTRAPAETHEFWERLIELFRMNELDRDARNDPLRIVALSYATARLVAAEQPEEVARRIEEVLDISGRRLDSRDYLPIRQIIGAKLEQMYTSGSWVSNHELSLGLRFLERSVESGPGVARALHYYELLEIEKPEDPEDEDPITSDLLCQTIGRLFSDDFSLPTEFTRDHLDDLRHRDWDRIDPRMEIREIADRPDYLLPTAHLHSAIRLASERMSEDGEKSHCHSLKPAKKRSKFVQESRLREIAELGFQTLELLEGVSSRFAAGE